ncbi:hypothetical protein PoMZ_06121, partial [Pyricularia oryzae]
MTSDKHPFLALMSHLPKSLKLKVHCNSASGSADYLSRLAEERFLSTGISKISIRLKDFLRHKNSNVNNLVARDNRSDAIPLSLEVSSVADASHNSSCLPERTSSPDPMAPPPALPVPTTLETMSSTALSIIPLSQIMPPAKRHREADTSEREPKITPEDFT